MEQIWKVPLFFFCNFNREILEFVDGTGGNGHGPVTDARECSAFYALLDTKHMADMAAAIGEGADAAKYPLRRRLTARRSSGEDMH
jgi:hypothetical protein